jgi:cholest-4-en-3-one 26-monooxygenase
MTSALDAVDLANLDRFERGEADDMLRVLRDAAPVYPEHPPGGPAVWNITRHADVLAVIRDARLFSSVPPPERASDVPSPAIPGQPDARASMMLSMDAPRHTRHRRLVNRGFTPRRIERLAPFFEEQAQRLIDEVIEQGECEFMGDVAARLPRLAIAEVMGIAPAERAQLFDWYERHLADLASGRDHQASLIEFFDYVNSLARERRASPREDILTTLASADVDGDRLSEIELYMFMLLLWYAGTETVQLTAGSGTHALMTNPDQYARLRAEPALLDSAVEEILRWASPFYAFNRTVTEDTEFRGQAMARGDQVTFWVASANRDESVFDDPCRFDITRSPNEHLSFAPGGPHFCLGAGLARLELRAIFRALAERVPELRPAGSPAWARSRLFRGFTRLPVSFGSGTPVGRAQ